MPSTPNDSPDVRVSVLATRTMETRIRLKHLSGWPISFSAVADQLVQALLSTMECLFKAKAGIITKNEFRKALEIPWSVPVSTGDAAGRRGTVKIHLTRAMVDNKWTSWRVNRDEVEAVVSLWMSHFSHSPAAVRNLWIVGPDTTFNRIVYDWWIYRGTECLQLKDYATGSFVTREPGRRVFDLGSLRTNWKAQIENNGEILAVVSQESLQRICGQHLLGCFLASAVLTVEKLEGKAQVTQGSSLAQAITLIHEETRTLAEAIQLSGLVSLEESYRLLIPALNDAGLLHDPLDILEEIVAAFRSRISPDDKSITPDNLEDAYGRLIYLAEGKAKMLADEERWADAGKLFLHLIDVLSHNLGSQDEFAVRARDAMTQFAAQFVAASNGAEAEQHHPQLQGEHRHHPPFQLHAAARNGDLAGVFQSLREGVGIDTWDDQHETPITLAIQGGFLDVVRLVIFYGAPVDCGLIYAFLEGESGTPGTTDSMGHLLLLNLSEKTKLLLEASSKGYSSIVQRLARTGIDLAIKDDAGNSPLHIAAISGSVEVVDILLTQGADVAAKALDGQTALHLAVERRNHKTVSLLVTAGANLSSQNRDGQTPLHIAAVNGDLTIAKYLVGQGADPEIREENGQAIIHIATSQGHEEFVQWLVDSGTDQEAKDKDQLTALHIAARCGYDKIISLLTKRPANLRAKDKYGQEPLTISAHKDGRKAIVEEMVARGAEIGARDVSGRSALEYSSLRGHTEIVRWLIENGAPFNHRDGFGRTALHYAVIYGHVETVRLLLSQGADVMAADKDGWTALHYANRIGDAEAKRTLMDAGADDARTDRLGKPASFYFQDGGEANFWSRPLPPPYPF